MTGSAKALFACSYYNQEQSSWKLFPPSKQSSTSLSLMTAEWRPVRADLYQTHSRIKAWDNQMVPADLLSAHCVSQWSDMIFTTQEACFFKNLHRFLNSYTQKNTFPPLAKADNGFKTLLFITLCSFYIVPKNRWHRAT